MKKFLITCLAMIMLLCIGIVAPSKSVDAADDGTPPTIDASSLKVDKASVAYGQTVKYSLKVTDPSGINRVIIELLSKGYDRKGYTLVLLYNEMTGLYEADYTPVYFGQHEIHRIIAYDYYGNSIHLYNSKATMEDTSFKENRADLSAGNFTVASGSYSPETAGPVIDFKTLTVSDKNPGSHSEATVRVKATDASPIAAIRMVVADRANCAYYDGTFDKITGYADIWMAVDLRTKTAPIRFIIYDAWGNTTIYGYKTSELYAKYITDGDTDINVDMSAASVNEGVEAVDAGAPEIDFSSMQIKKRFVARDDFASFVYRLKSTTPIVSVEYYVSGKNKDGVGYVGGNFGAYDSASNSINLSIHGVSYGDFEIYKLVLNDENGNKTIYEDLDSAYYGVFHPTWPGTEDAVAADLSELYFMVGVHEEKTDTLASNSTMDDTTTLGVDVLDQKGEKFDKLHKKDENVLGYYEVDVDGACNMSEEKTRVGFAAPAGYKDGDKLTIKHLLKDGSIQTQVATVEGGRVEIDVNEFSPFILEGPDKTPVVSKPVVSNPGTSGTTSTTAKKTFKYKGNTYKITSKTTATFVKPKNTKVTKITIPEKVKYGKKTYKVTGIASKAFAKNKKLKTLTIKSTKLTSKRVSKTAFKGLRTKAKIVVPKKKLKTYKKLMGKCGIKVKKYKITGK